jgi:UAA transporter family
MSLTLALVQVLAKSCKPIPVMLMGAALGKKYALKKYVNVVMIVCGVAMFMGGGKGAGKSGADAGGQVCFRIYMHLCTNIATFAACVFSVNVTREVLSLGVKKHEGSGQCVRMCARVLVGVCGHDRVRRRHVMGGGKGAGKSGADAGGQVYASIYQCMSLSV